MPIVNTAVLMLYRTPLGFTALRMHYSVLDLVLPETCSKDVTQVHHSFLHQNNSPANHVARFVSRAAYSFCDGIQLDQKKTCRPTRLTDTRTFTFLVPDDYQFLERVSPALSMMAGQLLSSLLLSSVSLTGYGRLDHLDVHGQGYSRITSTMDYKTD